MSEEKENTIDSETKILLKDSSKWMKTYSIILLVFFAIILVVLLIALTNLEDVYRMMGGQGITDKILERMRAFLLFIFIIFSLFGYGFVCLLKAGIGFGQSADSFIGGELTKSFKNFRLFWTISGISLVIILIYYVYVFF